MYRGYEAALAASGSASKPRSRSDSSSTTSRRGSSSSTRPSIPKPDNNESKRRSLVFSDDGKTVGDKVADGLENVKDRLGEFKINEKGKETRKALEEEQVPVVRWLV